MRYSKLFGKTIKSVPADISSPSHRLLYQAGYIRESTAGRYYFLPLGRKVQLKIMDLIRVKINQAGGQEMVTPILHPLSLWQETNRDNEAGFELMKIDDRRGASFALGGTAEEMFVDVLRKFQLSYKDLPFNVYQFSPKFRDELRARGGLLRVREFIMKDAYSFHTNEKDFKTEYQNMMDTYSSIFNALGLKTFIVEADNGYIGGDYSHEFVVESDAGESKFFVSEDGKYIAHEDVAKFNRELVNQDEEVKDFKIIEQPAWVKTMDDNVKHYGLSKSRFLKNVVYKNRLSKEIIIAVIRGDLDVNKTKLEQRLKMVGQLEDAEEEDIRKRLKSKPGYVHSWGHKDARYIGDLSLKTVKNFVGGQKEETTDSKNVNYGRDFECEMLADIALARDGDITEEGQKLAAKLGIEVGNVFQLGYHYSKKMNNATFTDSDGKNKPYYMGCYGIGIGRTMATVAEIHHDDKGLIWPEEIAPYKIHLLGLNLDQDAVIDRTEKVYQLLLDHGIEVLYDDREDVSPGEKFKDADLIGIPWRLVVSAKTEDKVEIKHRTGKETKLVDLEKLLEEVG